MIRWSRLVRWYLTGIPFGILASLCLEMYFVGTGSTSSHTPMGWALVNSGAAAAEVLAVVGPVGLLSLWGWSRVSLSHPDLERNLLSRTVGLVVLAIGLTCLVSLIVALIQVSPGPWSFVRIRANFRAGYDASVLMLVAFAAAFVAPRLVVASLRGPFAAMHPKPIIQ